MVGEHIENAVKDDPVVGLLLQLLGEAHIEQCIQAGRAGVFLRLGLQVPAVGVYGEVMLLAEHLLAEASHGNVVAPFAALLCHEPLQSVSHFPLSRRKRADDLVQLFRRQRVSKVGNLRLAVLVGRHAYTFSQNVSNFHSSPWGKLFS